MVERGGESLQVSLVNIESVATSFLFLVTSLGVSPHVPCHPHGTRQRELQRHEMPKASPRYGGGAGGNESSL